MVDAETDVHMGDAETAAADEAVAFSDEDAELRAYLLRYVK